MWTSTIDLDFKKVLLAQLIGRFYRNIYFSSYSPLQVQNLPRQSLPATSWVRVRNRLSGICGSDLHLIYGDGDVRVAPAAVPGRKYLYPGHELVGEVIEIGDDVHNLHVGDRVVLQSSPNCLAGGIKPLCRFCTAGSYNLCENSAMSPQPIGGGWSEEMLVHEQQLFRLPATLNDEQAVMLEPTAVAIHAVLRRLPKKGERVLIIGAGTIGLSMLQIIRALAPQAEISVLARHAFQIERATRLGATHIIYPYDAYVGVKRATQAKLYQGTLGNQTLSGGYDIIYDTVGQRKTLHNALRWTRAQGTIVLVGTNLHLMHLDLTPVWFQEINLLGSTSHGTEIWPLGSEEQRSTFGVALELIEQGHIAPEQLITHHFALNNYKHALLTVTHKAESRAIKVLFDYSLLPASVVPNVRASAPRRRPVTVNFNIDYTDLEQERVEHATEKQAEQEELQTTPVLEKHMQVKQTRPSLLQTTKIQDTPSIRPFAKEIPPSSDFPAMHKPDSDEGENTESALPVVGKSTQIVVDQQHSLPTTSTPTLDDPHHASPPELPTPKLDESYQVFPLELHSADLSEPTHDLTLFEPSIAKVDIHHQPIPSGLYTPEHYDLSLQSTSIEEHSERGTLPHQSPAPWDEKTSTTNPGLVQDTPAAILSSSEKDAENVTNPDPIITAGNEQITAQDNDYASVGETDVQPDQEITEQPVVDETQSIEQSEQEEMSVEKTTTNIIATESSPQINKQDDKMSPAQATRNFSRKRKNNYK